MAPLQAAAVGLSASTPGGIALVVVSLVLAAESATGGKGKEYLAKSYAKDDTILQEKVEYNLEMLATFLSLGSALMVSGSTDTASQAAGLMGAVHKVGGIFYEKKMNDSQADLIQIRYECERAEKKWGKASQLISSLEEKRLDNIKKIMKILKGDFKAAVTVIRD